ncbi:MAG: glucohydrolase, partial [Bacillales bacterium]|nr:glucohydrolase [Bacillales bacterium]
NENVFSKYNILTVGEVGGGASPEEALLYSGYSRKEIDMVFTFDHCWANGAYGSVNKKDEELKTDLVDLKRTFAKWQNGIMNKGWNPLYWLNHDHPRLMSQYGNIKYHQESGKMLANVLHFMWGTPFIYQGEEIGMTNVFYNDFNDFKDVGDQNYINEVKKNNLDINQAFAYLRRTSRDNARTPLQWSNEEHGGFSKAIPWQKEVGNQQEINIHDQQLNEYSILNYYKKCIQLRRNSLYSDVIIYGNFELLFENDTNLFIYKRVLENTTILSINNFFDKEVFLDIDFKVEEVLINNYDDYNKNIKRILRPYEAMVIKI